MRTKKINSIFLVANGNLKHITNRNGWDAQTEMENMLVKAFSNEEVQAIRAHSYSEELGHGFIWNQRMGINVINSLDPYSAVVVAVGIWQFSQNILSGLRNHQGPILTVGNWSGKYPGLVGLLNLNASFVKANVPYSTIWSKTFDDDFFLSGIRQWIHKGKIDHLVTYPQQFDHCNFPNEAIEKGNILGSRLLKEKPIIGVFDEGCMGMYNAIIDDELLNNIGIYKERLSQSALLAEMKRIPDREAQHIRSWLDARGMTFVIGTDEATALTDRQILEQCKMYIAAARIADYFGCESIGIQYSSGLKDMAPASDLAESLLNNPDRPPVSSIDGKRVIFQNTAIPHFNEADEGAAIDMVVNSRVWKELDLDPSTTLHDVRWGEHWKGLAYTDSTNQKEIDDFVWLFMISGAIPASHFQNGYAEAYSYRQPPTSFIQGGGTVTGISKPGEFVWSRVYIKANTLRVDIGRGTSLRLPPEETVRRWKETTPEWPMMNAILHGVSRDQFMARHMSNHITITYASSPEQADRALAIKAAMMKRMGLDVYICGKNTIH